MEIEDKVRNRRILGLGVGSVMETSEFGTVRVDFGRAGKLWVLETNLELATVKQDSLRVPANVTPKFPGLCVKAGWLVEHDEFGWGEVFAREGQNVLIGFQLGDKILTDGGIPGHVLQYDDQAASNDPRRVTHRDWPTNWTSTPITKWSRHQFSRPNTRAWNW